MRSILQSYGILPEKAPSIGVAVSGAQSCGLAAEYADVMIAVEPEADLIRQFEAAGGAGKPKVGQIPVCFDRDEQIAVDRAHSLFRWFGGGWKVNAELSGDQGIRCRLEIGHQRRSSRSHPVWIRRRQIRPSDPGVSRCWVHSRCARANRREHAARVHRLG